MFGSAVLDTAIGLLLVFFTVSTVCSNIYTLIARMINARGKLLNNTLQRLLGEHLLEEILTHPMIGETKLKNMRLLGFDIQYERNPEWIDPTQFSIVLADICMKAKNVSDITRVLPARLSDPVEYFVQQLQEGRRTYEELTHDIEHWYNNTMNQLTDIFKRYSQLFIAVIALVITLLFNINTLVITDTLWQSPTLRDAVVEAANAQVVVSNQNPDAELPPDASIAQVVEEDLSNLTVLNIPIGWTPDELGQLGLPDELAMAENRSSGAPSVFIMIIGWGITIGAAMFGAPFWFDLLNKVVSLRGSRDNKS